MLRRRQMAPDHQRRSPAGQEWSIELSWRFLIARRVSFPSFCLPGAATLCIWAKAFPDSWSSRAVCISCYPLHLKSGGELVPFRIRTAVGPANPNLGVALVSVCGGYI